MSATSLLADLFIAAVFLLFGVQIHRLTERKQEPCWTSRTTIVLSPYSRNVSGLVATFRDQRLDSLAVTDVAIWNRGCEAVRSSDMATYDPLRIESVHATILEASVSRSTRAIGEIVIRVNESENSVLIDFDYLNKHDGCVVRVLHVGVSHYPLTVQGNFPSAGKIRHVQNSEWKTQVRLRYEVRLQGVITLVLVCVVVGTYFSTQGWAWNASAILTALLALVALTSIFAWMTAREYAPTVPPDLQLWE